MVSSSNPRHDFKSAITVLVPWMETFAAYSLIHVLVNAIFLMFWGNGKTQRVNIAGIFFGLLGILATLGAVISVAVVSSAWNELNDSQNSFYHLHKSVFVGNIKNIQTAFNLEFILGFVLFLPINIFLTVFWILKLRQVQ